MTTEGPAPDPGNTWKRAASNPPSRGLVIRLLAIGAAVVVALAGWGLWSVFGSFNQITGDAEEFASGAIAKIAAHWDAAEFAKLANAPFAGTPLAERYGILGDFVSVGKCTVYQINLTNASGTAQVSCRTEFSAAKPTVSLGILKEGGQWKIYDLTVSL